MADDHTDEGVVEGEIVEDDPRSQELVIHEEREHAQPPASVLPSPREWEATLAVAREIAATQFVPESYRGRPESVVAAILTGREMGIGPMQSLRQIHMIDGRPAFAADLMMAKMRQGGLVVIESSVTSERAYIKARRKDTGEEAEVEWTIEQAREAGLLDKKGQSWKRYPTDMLWARAVGRLARRLGSDLLGGLVYSKEEMEDWDDDGYGGAYGYEATTERPFDPDRDLLPGAITGEGYATRLRDALRGFDPTVVWQSVIDSAIEAKWGQPDLRHLTDNERIDFWRRLSNAVQWITDHTPAGDFPPVDGSTIVAGFEFAFGKMALEVPYAVAERPEVAKEHEEKEEAPISAEQTALIDEQLAKEDVDFPEPGERYGYESD